MRARSTAEVQGGPNAEVGGSSPSGRTNHHIDELGPLQAHQVYEHLLRLSPEDRHLRFCIGASDSYIHRYVFEVMDLQRDYGFGAYIDGKLVGMAHIAVVGESSCELAFSIDAEHRGSGMARNLMRTAIAKCRELGVNKLCMSCLRENKKMQSLARSFGLSMTIDFNEAYAELGITK